MAFIFILVFNFDFVLEYSWLTMLCLFQVYDKVSLLLTLLLGLDSRLCIRNKAGRPLGRCWSHGTGDHGAWTLREAAKEVRSNQIQEAFLREALFANGANEKHEKREEQKLNPKFWPESPKMWSSNLLRWTRMKDKWFGGAEDKNWLRMYWVYHVC